MKLSLPQHAALLKWYKSCTQDNKALPIIDLFLPCADQKKKDSLALMSNELAVEKSLIKWHIQLTDPKNLSYQRCLVHSGMIYRNETLAKAFTPLAKKKIGTMCMVFRRKRKRVTGLYLKMLFTIVLKVKGYAIVE